MEELGAVKEGTGLIRDLFGWVRGLRRRPKLVVTAEVGAFPFNSPQGVRTADFIWLNVRNSATSAHSDANAVLGHVWVYDDAGHEVFTLRARWRATQPSAGAITDRLKIGSGLTEQLDAVWKYPDEETAYGLNSEAIAREPRTWQDHRYALPPGHYRLRVKVEPTNGPPSEASFRFVQPGVGPLTIESQPTPSIELDDLAQAGEVLAKLAGEVPMPRDDMEAKVLIYALITIRARSLYANLLHSLASPVAVGGPIAIAPLVELGILAKWLSIDPVNHTSLWVADSDATELSMVQTLTNLMTERGNAPAEHSADELKAREANREAARQQLSAAGKDYGDRLIPSLEQMVEEVEVAYPGFRMAIRESYHMAYSVFTPWANSEASSFKATAETTEGDHWRYVGDQSPYKAIDLKAIGTSGYAFILETVLLGVEKVDEAAMARAVRTFVTQHWARPEPDA